MSAAQLMQRVALETGVKFTLENGAVGLTKAIPKRLLAQVKNHKSEIKEVLLGLQNKDAEPKAASKCSKVWNIKIKTGNEINSMSMIDPDRMNREECKRVLVDKFGTNRIIELKERK